MEGSGLVNKLKFTPITEVVSPNSVFVQTSNILDIAASIAYAKEDVESLINIAAVYAELGSRLVGYSNQGDDEEEEDEDYEKHPLGFSPPVVIEPTEVEMNDE